ncbi:hypothetical protein BDC45DRAFT_580495 [Circinella umbellata]|nr:hypothetical protein BDC45DRAFT_580495 [Circinella umbellata]
MFLAPPNSSSLLDLLKRVYSDSKIEAIIPPLLGLPSWRIFTYALQFTIMQVFVAGCKNWGSIVHSFQKNTPNARLPFILSTITPETDHMIMNIRFLYENGKGSVVDKYGMPKPVDYIVDEE